MSKSKLALLVVLSSGCCMALGLNCIPNVGTLFAGLTAGLRGLIGA